MDIWTNITIFTCMYLICFIIYILIRIFLDFTQVFQASPRFSPVSSCFIQPTLANNGKQYRWLLYYCYRYLSKLSMLTNYSVTNYKTRLFPHFLCNKTKLILKLISMTLLTLVWITSRLWYHKLNDAVLSGVWYIQNKLESCIQLNSSLSHLINTRVIHINYYICIV